MTAVLNPGRPFTSSERKLFEDTLDVHRAESVRAVEDLSDAEAHKRRVSSLTTPIALVRHCAVAERIWFQRTLGGLSIGECDGLAQGGDASFGVAEGERLAAAIAECRAGAGVRGNWRLVVSVMTRSPITSSPR